MGARAAGDWLKEFSEAGAIWMHDGNPARPHALLTSGLHSDGFVNCTLVTQRPEMLSRLLRAPDGLAPRLPKEPVDWVAGSAMGAVTFAYAVAERLGARAAFTEKDGEAMKLARFEIQAGAKVLVVEDVISTGGSTLKTIQAIEAAGEGRVEVLPFILCLVNRSGAARLAAREIRALLSPAIHAWKPEECPLCRAGSKVLRPKGHWRELSADPRP
jgi:orotate phosphoribosyltransferase